MPITNTEDWKKHVDANADEPYGKACVDVAREAMRLLDEQEGEFDPHTLICKASTAAKTGGITGFMAGCAASMISQCHSRGDEFRRAWNTHNQIGDEGDRANDGDGILNPALLTIRTPNES